MKSYTVLISSLMPLVLEEVVAGPSARLADSCMLSFVESDGDLGVSLDMKRFR
jgi:hypothetical protein